MDVESQEFLETLRQVVAKHFGRNINVVHLLYTEKIEYYSIGPEFSGPVYTYRLSRKRWPYKAYVFQMRNATGALRWSLYPDDEFEHIQCPLDAVKAALGKRWREESELNITASNEGN